MLSTIEAPSLEPKTEKWKGRAEAKQQWLQKALAEPPADDEQAARRRAWIQRALRVVKRAQAAIKYQTGLVDAYAQHLNALEMTLMSAAENNPGPGGSRPDGQK